MNSEESLAHDQRAQAQRTRRSVLPVIGIRRCCNTGLVRRWPTGALECDNYYCSIMGLSIDEFHTGREPHQRPDPLQMTVEEIQMMARGMRQ